MLKDPGLYGVGIDYREEPGLVQKRADIVHSAAVLLEKCQLIKYERGSGRFQSTELGKIASHYYVTYNSMMVYNKHLKPTMSTLELFRVFALSNEFKLIPVRQEVSFMYFLGWLGFINGILGENGAFKVTGEGSNSGQRECRRTRGKDQCIITGVYFTIKARRIRARGRYGIRSTVSWTVRFCMLHSFVCKLMVVVVGF